MLGETSIYVFQEMEKTITDTPMCVCLKMHMSELKRKGG